MANDLTNSLVDRQNVLNNRYALSQAEAHLTLGGTLFNDEWMFTKQQVMALFEVSEATIERYLAAHNDETKSQRLHFIARKKTQRIQDLK